MKCWAESLGGCGGKSSGEHLVSKSLFLTKVVRVQGFDWCKEPKDIGLASLTSNCLCRTHNNQLSPVDDAGESAFSTLREVRRLANIRQKLKPTIWKIRRHRIDGRGLERWFLKTLINICSAYQLPIGRESDSPGKPTDHLVRVAYGLQPFRGEAGLYSVARNGQIANSDDHVGFSAIHHLDSHIIAGGFTFRGLRFLLYLEPEGPPKDLRGISISGEDLGDNQLLFHLKSIKEQTGKYLSQSITIDW